MGYCSTKLFAWLQGADFYKNLHYEAIEKLPASEGKKWVDVGCGPGLLTRLAAAKGYLAIGIDADSFMIQEAKKIARNEASSAHFKIGDVFRIPPQSADIVSASSLLAALEDKVGGFQSLLSIVKPGGSLLIIEPTNQMTPQAVATLIRGGLGGKRISGLRLWARARAGRAVNPEIFKASGAVPVIFTPLLNGLVGAWLIQKE
ncbi:MAG: class I SAM-dependent methyltransferase [Acidobacteria bacterium]|nr:class I SAM-dependent methyltransferase [Acidobacteriota bacterium]